MPPTEHRFLDDAGATVLNLVTETRMHELPGLGEVDPKSFSPNDLHRPRIDRRLLAEALDKTVAAARDAGIEFRMPRMPRCGRAIPVSPCTSSRAACV